jgi:two-component system sensor histidine kinase BaeS
VAWTSPLQTIRARLTSTYAALALLAVILSGVFTSVAVQGVILDRLGLDLVGEARVLADRISQPLARGDLEDIRAYVERIDPLTTALIVVVDTSGAGIAASTRLPPESPTTGANLRAALSGQTVIHVDAWPTPNSPPFFRHAPLVQVAVPVVDSDGQVIGALQESYRLEEIAQVRHEIVSIIALGALLAALIAAVLGAVVAASVARPVQQVSAAVLHLAEHRPGATLPEPHGSTRELLALVAAFNRLAHQLGVHEHGRREFASDVSHELHSLASAMQTAATALERGAERDNPQLGRQLVAGLVGHTRRLNRLAADLLELARWEGGRLELEFEDLDLADLVLGILDEWAAEMEERGVTLQVSLPDCGLPVRGDPIRLTQALGNVVENALKYAGRGQLRVRVQVEPGQTAYEVVVEDSGPGIPEETLPYLFERYFRVEGRAGGGPGGMGLGLAIARAVARAHGGDLTAESEPPSGARFVLRVPAARAERVAPAAPSSVSSQG